jgi:hypothetical protein
VLALYTIAQALRPARLYRCHGARRGIIARTLVREIGQTSLIEKPH